MLSPDPSDEEREPFDLCCLPVNRVRFKLIPEPVQVFQALGPVDQVCVGDGIRRARK